MNKNRTKCTIYIRTFSALFAIYFVLMSGFSVFMILQQKKIEQLKFQTLVSQVGNSVGETICDSIDDNNHVTDISKIKKELVKKSAFLNRLGPEIAIYTGDYNQIYHTNDNWLCIYTERTEGNTNYSGYGMLNPKDWFSDKEINEISNYLYTESKVKKVGELTGYLVELDGFWLDDEMIIPDKINIIPMIAETINKDGNFNSSFGDNQNKIVFASGYKDTKGLPYFKSGNIQPAQASDSNKDKTRLELRKLLLNSDKLKAAVEQPVNTLCERVTLVKYRYYLPMPYQQMMKMKDDQKYYSDYWTVAAEEVNVLDKCAGTLLFMWLSCFLTFFTAAWILAAQTYKTYKEREKLEKNRKETTNALAHDLKTPLSIISGYAQNLIENVHVEKRNHYAANILTNVNRMDMIIREMLQFSKLESEQFQMKLENISLGKVCEEIMNRYKPVYEEKSMKVNLTGDALIKADYCLMQRVIDNFFINALNHTPSGGGISITILNNMLEIYNSGSSIPEDKMKEIWKPYIKVDEARSNTKGTGLGLSISSTILDLYNFSYGVKNSDDGVIFWFKFA